MFNTRASSIWSCHHNLPSLHWLWLAPAEDSRGGGQGSGWRDNLGSGRALVHAMGIHNSTARLSGKAMLTPLSHPVCLDLCATAALSGWAQGGVASPPTPTSRPSPAGVMRHVYTGSFCQFPTASQCSLQQQKRNSCSWLLWFLINWNTFLLRSNTDESSSFLSCIKNWIIYMTILSLNINRFLSNSIHLNNRLRNQQEKRAQFWQNLN